MTHPILFSVENIKKIFKSTEGQELLVLNNISFQMKENEIIAILGKSGSGKSTLLRIITGLIQPSEGQVTYRGQKVNNPIQGIAMVFQSFALLPWLSVLQNVELGLEALGIPHQERRTRALKAIDTIGLDGFESAYPKELSGGMRQRVGFARALVVEPELLVMDEPFSALDVLTGENLRSDLLSLWQDKHTKTKGILFVTHNIEEALLMADRIILLDSDPGRIRAEIQVTSSIPRNSKDEDFKKLLDQIYTLMTTTDKKRKKRPQIILTYRVPNAEISELTGLLEELATYSGKVDLPDLADSWHLEVDDLFPLTEALEKLAFATVSKGDISLTPIGQQFATADILNRKKIFAKQLTQQIPLAEYIRKTLDTRSQHKESKEYFLKMLMTSISEPLTEDEAERILKVIIDWGRYAEIFAYNYDSGYLSLENPK